MHLLRRPLHQFAGFSVRQVTCWVPLCNQLLLALMRRWRKVNVPPHRRPSSEIFWKDKISHTRLLWGRSWVSHFEDLPNFCHLNSSAFWSPAEKRWFVFRRRCSSSLCTRVGSFHFSPLTRQSLFITPTAAWQRLSGFIFPSLHVNAPCLPPNHKPPVRSRQISHWKAH